MPTRVEAICRFHRTHRFTDLKGESREMDRAYRELSPDEISELVELALDEDEGSATKVGRWKGAPPDLHAILETLACLYPGSLRPYQHRFVERQLFATGLLYHGADGEVALALAARVSDADSVVAISNLLCCLAWVGNAEVRRLFSKWRQEPPDWASKLYVPPHRYAHEAGWELLPDGERGDLFSPAAIPLVKPEATERRRDGVSVGIPAEARCPWCGRQLVSLLELEGNVKALVAPGSPLPALRMTTCHVCSSYGTVYGKCDDNGNFSWHPANVRPSYLPDTSSDWPPFAERPLVAAEETRHYMESASWTRMPQMAFSQVGGLPTWVQDSEYPACPECHRTMAFIGQISNEDFEDLAEGIEYCFFCSQCGVTATNYQQS